MTLDTRFLHSKLGRRIVLLFISCALFPMVVLAVTSFTHVTRELTEVAHRKLQRESKAVGMAVFQRLSFLEKDLQIVSSKLQNGSSMSHNDLVELFGKDFSQRFKGLALVGSGGAQIPLLGRVQPPATLTAAERQHVRSGKTVVSIQGGRGLPAHILLRRAVDFERPGQGLLVAEVDPVFLWDLGEDSSLPAMNDLCVFNHVQQVLACSHDRPIPVSEGLSALLSRSHTGQGTWEQGEEDYFAGFWSIPLKHKFLSPPWTVVLSEPKALALAPTLNFKYTFSLVVLLSLWVVALLSVSQIRRSLVPLEQLREGTQRIAKKDFATRVNLSSGDEFEELARSFNTMASRLGKQFSTLATISEIDRAVLSALDTRRVADTVLAKLPDALPCDSVHLSLCERSDTERAWTYTLLANSEQETSVEGVTLTQGFVQSLKEHPDHLTLDRKDIPESLLPLAASGMTTLLLLPLFRSGQLSGFISLGYRTRPRLSSDDLVRARQLADQVAAALANADDLAERKRAEESLKASNTQLADALAELKTTQTQMVQQERLRALGQMASGIAHDFNNTLAPIVGFTELLLMNARMLDNKDKVTEQLKIIHTAGQDAAKVVSRLRDFYRPPEKEDMTESVNLNELIHQAIDLTQPKWKNQAWANGIAVSMQTDLQDIPSMAGNKSELREILTNLIFNAVDALSESGTITLGTRSEAGQVVLSVSDTGRGMNEETRQRCLEPFFSTKGDKGTGLGLSMVYGIIQRHGGTIDIKSEPGRGTNFSIRFPVQRVEQSENQGGDEIHLPRQLRILVVDDDPLACRVTTEYLSSMEYTVDTATSGPEGLNKFQEGQFDLVMTDQGMPDMNGDQLAAAIKTASPDTPVILLTGAGRMPEVNGSGMEGIDAVVHKPLTMTVLRKVLGKIMGAGRRPNGQTVESCQ